jgi:hypothetical protein
MNNQITLIMQLKDEIEELKLLNDALEITNDIWSKRLIQMQRRCEQCKNPTEKQT